MQAFLTFKITLDIVLDKAQPCRGLLAQNNRKQQLQGECMHRDNFAADNLPCFLFLTDVRLPAQCSEAELHASKSVPFQSGV